MADKLKFDYYGSPQPYLNQNIWLEDPTVLFQHPVGAPPAAPDKREILAPVVFDPYQAVAVVHYAGLDRDPPVSSLFNVSFFLCPASTQPDLSKADLDFRGTGDRNGINKNDWGGFQAPDTGVSYPDPGSFGHYCLVAVIYLTNPNPGEESNYVDTQGIPRTTAPVINTSDSTVAQRNYIESSSFRPPGNGITNLVKFDISGSTNPKGSSLVIRAPRNEVEIEGLRALMGPGRIGIIDVTAKARVGLFSSDPTKEGQQHAHEDELRSLPLETSIEDLGPGCTRALYLGLEVPQSLPEQTSTVYTLIEQYDGDGKLLGGIAVVAFGPE